MYLLIQSGAVTVVITVTSNKHKKRPILLPAATKLGQGYIFTGVCHSVNRGVCLSACWDAHPSLAGIPPLADRPPSRQTRPAGRPPGRQTLPPGRQTPHWQADPLAGRPPPRYGQCSAGTHPTGMHTFLF